jgi:hypothetical protein
MHSFFNRLEDRTMNLRVARTHTDLALKRLDELARLIIYARASSLDGAEVDGLLYYADHLIAEMKHSLDTVHNQLPDPESDLPF